MKKMLLAATALVAISSTANAEDRFPKWYLGLSAGASHQNDSDFKNSTASGDFGWDTGSLFTTSLGYTPEMGGFRYELEGSWRSQDLSTTGGGDVKVTNVAMNVLYDFANDSTITPYVGAGLGYGRFEYNGSLPGVTGDDSSSELTYQALLGLGYEMQSLPNVGFNVGYRYFAPFSDPEIGTGASKTEFEYDNHSVELGAKFRF